MLKKTNIHCVAKLQRYVTVNQTVHVVSGVLWGVQQIAEIWKSHTRLGNTALLPFYSFRQPTLLIKVIKLLYEIFSYSFTHC